MRSLLSFFSFISQSAHGTKSLANAMPEFADQWRSCQPINQTRQSQPANCNDSMSSMQEFSPDELDSSLSELISRTCLGPLAPSDKRWSIGSMSRQTSILNGEVK